MQTRISFTIQLLFFIQCYCREGNTVSRFITSHQILQYYTSAVYYTHISVAGLCSLCLTDDTEGNMHQRKYPFVDCRSLTNEIKITNAIINTNVAVILHFTSCIRRIIQRFLRWGKRGDTNAAFLNTKCMFRNSQNIHRSPFALPHNSHD